MLTILIGRAGSGKTRRVLADIAAEREKREQILLVPEHASHEAEIDLCRACGDTASCNAEVLSFRSLATRVLGEMGGLSDFTLDNGGKILTLRRCLQELAPQLKVFGKPSQHVTFLQQMMALFDEFYAYDVVPSVLYEQTVTIDGVEGDKLRDVALLFAAYDAKLHHDGYDARSRMQKLFEKLQNATYLVGKDLYLDGFSFLNRLEEKVLETALQQCNQVTVTLLGDRYDRILFRNASVQKERLVRMAAQKGIRCRILFAEEDREPAAALPPLQHMERYLFDGDRIWEGENPPVELYEAGTAYHEVEYVAWRIRTLVQQGYRYRDIAVAARNMEVYAPLLEKLFHRHEIPAYMSCRSDILEKPGLQMLLGAVDAVTGGFEYEDMFRYLKTGIAGISEDECDLLENYVIRWQIRGNMWVNDALWTANPDGYGAEMTPYRQAQLDEINRIRSKVIEPLRRLYGGLRAHAGATDKVRAVYAFLEESSVPETLQQKAQSLLNSGEVQLAEEYRQLWDILCNVLDQFVTILNDTQLENEEFARLLRMVLTQYSVGTIPSTLDQVKVSEITRNDRHQVKVLFLLGANDDVLPTVNRERGILRDEDRQLLMQHDIPLSGATFDELDNELQNIYACLAQPTERLIVCWPSTDLAGAQKRPSFVVERLERLFPTLKRSHEDGNYRRTLPQTALELAANDMELRQYFSRTDIYRDVFEGMERAERMQRGRLSPKAVRSLYGNAVSMSASRMDKIKSCHFAYFMQYGLRAKERKNAAFDAPEIGTFIHYLLENVNREVKEKGGYDQVDNAELRRIVKQYTDYYAATQIEGYEHKSARFRYLFTRLRKAAYSIVENMAQELRESDFKPLAFELGFGGKNSDLPEISITEGDTKLAVTGKVDRVDGWLHNGKLYLRVVDYKTGRKAFDLADIRYGLGIQMLLYLFTLQNEGKAYFGSEIVPCGVLYHPARDVILRMERGADEASIQKELQKELRRSGIVLSDPEVLRAMEHSALDSPCYLPIGVNKDGNITGSIADMAQLGKLGQYVDKLLHEIAGEIGRGEIAADPCSRGPQQSACDYCPYFAACYYDEGRDRPRYLKKTDPQEFWEEIQRETEGHHGR